MQQFRDQADSPAKAGLRRLKRAAAALAIACVLGAGLWFWWAQVAASRLGLELDAIHARHEPLLPGNFANPSIPPARDATTYLTAAFKALSRTVYTPSSTALIINIYPPYPPEWHRLEDKALAANRKALALVHRAAGCSTASGIGFGQLNIARELANIISDAALDAHLRGDDSLAIERIQDARADANALDRGSLINHLVAFGVEALANERLEVMLPDLRVQGDLAAHPGHDHADVPASRAALRSLIAELLDEPRARHLRRLAVLEDRSDEYAACAGLRDAASVLRPMFNLELARILRYQDAYLRAADQPDLTSALALIARAGVPPDIFHGVNGAPVIPSPPRYSRIISQSTVQPRDRDITAEWGFAAQRRALAIVIAIRLYRAQYGRWPANLDVLVPEFLPAVPRDPLAVGTPSIRYVILKRALPGRNDRPILCFGSKAHDRKIAPPPSEPCFGDGLGNVWWVDLSRWYPSAAATQAAGGS